MAREGLELELRAAIHAAASEGVLTLNRQIQVKTNGGFSTVGLSVRPLPGPDRDKLLLVSFQDIASPTARPKRSRAAKPAELGRIQELEHDLAYLKESHQAAIEEQQATNEEIKSTNEELQSTNEELQSTNEELETSKEELQSVNEELITVNSELQRKIEQLASMQNDMKNLLDNINIGIVFLDQHLSIRSFTREAVRIYRLADSDVGRPLADIRPVVAGEDLLVAAQGVLDSLIPYECEMQIDGGAWMLARIQPYRTLENLIDGVVLTFTDITERIKAVANRDALELAEGIVNTLREPLVVLDGALQVITVSAAFYREFQVTPEETLGRRIYDLGNHQWDIPALRSLLESILARAESFDAYVVEHDFPNIGHRRILLNARRIVGRIGEPQMMLLSMEVNAS
ncbi:PAS domain-containing protein [Propionivibrio sp.]|uniref:PAS domain-containing protein n=1 Tax=Propionivibrio sp. TaxID=2212460 RepID=UPI0025F8B31C|nr:PAS domain-containing protein [Propionivibrio sp.]